MVASLAHRRSDSVRSPFDAVRARGRRTTKCDGGEEHRRRCLPWNCFCLCLVCHVVFSAKLLGEISSPQPKDCLLCCRASPPSQLRKWFGDLPRFATSYSTRIQKRQNKILLLQQVEGRGWRGHQKDGLFSLLLYYNCIQKLLFREKRQRRHS